MSGWIGITRIVRRWIRKPKVRLLLILLTATYFLLPLLQFRAKWTANQPPILGQYAEIIPFHQTIDFVYSDYEVENVKTMNEFHRPNIINYYAGDRSFSSALWTVGCPNHRHVHHHTCFRPRQKLLFMKVHKSGSSTVSNIILRYARRNKLKIALPKFGDAHIGYPMMYRPYYILNHKRNENYDVIASHFTYDRCYVQKDFPKNKFIYVTILRDPWTQFISTLNYFTFPDYMPPNLTKPFAENLLNNFDKYAVPIALNLQPNLAAKKNLFKNMMSTDLGFPNSQASNRSAIYRFIERIDEDFDLVMIMEYFHESLVLLKRKMCWEMKDIFHLKVNPKRIDRTSDETFTQVMRQKHVDVNSVDYQLYDYFKAKFEKRFIHMGPDLLREMEVFKKLNQKVDDFCNFKILRQSSSVTLARNEFMEEDVTISRTDCHALRRFPSDIVANMKEMSKMEKTPKTCWFC